MYIKKIKKEIGDKFTDISSDKKEEKRKRTSKTFEKR